MRIGNIFSRYSKELIADSIRRLWNRNLGQEICTQSLGKGIIKMDFLTGPPKLETIPSQDLQSITSQTDDIISMENDEGQERDRKWKRNPSEDVAICYCEKKEIKCNAIENMEVLKIQLYAVNTNCSATKLRLSGVRLPALPHEMLQTANFTDIRIQSSYLPFLSSPMEEENPFTGGELVAKFTLDTVNYPFNWNWSVMSVCYNLKEMRIMKSDMIYIGPTFRMMKLLRLETLVIDKSNVKWIHDGAFSTFKGLAFFHFINNFVKVFKRSFLPDPAQNLNVVNFRNNELEFLDDDLFLGMPELTYVNLENNNLITVSEFKSHAFFVNLSGNPLRCDCSIKWLRTNANSTDVYRLYCYTPDPDAKKLWIKHVNWKAMDC